MSAELNPGVKGSQTLLRGLDILDIVAAQGPITLKDLTDRIGLTRSTTHRLASALVERDMLRLDLDGYALGARILSLDAAARHHRTLPGVAHPHILALARAEQDPVNLAVRDGHLVRYIDQVRGTRRIEVRSIIGETRPLTSTGLGRALLLDDDEAAWRQALSTAASGQHNETLEQSWLASMRTYRIRDVAFDIEENADGVRCVAAPIRDAGGRIVAALSLSSLPQYMSDERMVGLVAPVRATADAISADLGWRRR